jgi:rubrerythrin
MSKRNIAIVSSGDPVKDAAEIASAELHQQRMDANICPNGCGPMIQDDPHNQHCPVCNFVGWCNVPCKMGDA